MVRKRNGEVMYQEYVAAENTKFGRILNVDDLSAGTYYVEVKSNGVSQKQLFTIGEEITTRSLNVMPQ